MLKYLITALGVVLKNMPFLKETKNRNGSKPFGFSLKSCLDQEKQRTVESNYRLNLCAVVVSVMDISVPLANYFPED